MKRYAEDINQQSHMLEDSKGEWVKYADVYEEFGEKCDCCGAIGHDRRTLYMACGYAMSELEIPFEKCKVPELPGFNQRELYTLHVCKGCRSRWMQAIKDWFNMKEDDD